MGLLAVVWNETHDYTYATYVISMWVWVSGAYVVIQAMRSVHGSVTVRLVCKYLILVCVLQCLIAFAMEHYLPLKNFVDSFLAGEGFMGKMKDRLYGIGASLDVAGSRFSVILVMISFLLIDNAKKGIRKYIGLYLVAFVIVALIGNMISRTTTVGLLLSFAYLIYASMKNELNADSDIEYVWKWILGGCVIGIPLIIYWYHTDLLFQENLRFAFEGFFSLVEKGKWEVSSNEILKSMYVFPESLKTWFIGDGYFNNPYDSEPFYVGPKWEGFYQNTDVGYLRFIFYFGLIGLFAFSFFIYKTAVVCMRRFKDYRNLFLLILLLNFVIWLKVSTDLFLVFALFLCLLKEESEDPETKEFLEEPGQ